MNSWVALIFLVVVGAEVLVRLAGRTIQVAFGNTALGLTKKCESTHLRKRHR